MDEAEFLQQGDVAVERGGLVLLVVREALSDLVPVVGPQDAAARLGADAVAEGEQPTGPGRGEFLPVEFREEYQLVDRVGHAQHIWLVFT